MRRASLIWGLSVPFAGALALSSLPSVAQAQSGLASAMLEEVVVTARRREESLEDLPLSIQAISADAMQAQGIYNVEAISDFVPNLQLQDDIRTNDTRIFIRGIGGGFSNPAQIFGVGMYVDGHYMSGTLGAFMSTVDVERVEVLRGPQGTLFGKNTTGGAVSIITAKPHEEFESYVTLRGGEFGQQDIRGMINVPITDNLFFRGNAAKETSDGYYYNRWTGEDVGGNDQTSVGLALRWEANENWTVDSRLSIARDRDENRGGQCVPGASQSMLDILRDPDYLATYDATRASEVFGITNGGQQIPDSITALPGDEGVGRWGGSSQNRGPGGNIDYMYNGAALDNFNNCLQDFNAGPWVTSQNMSYTDSNVNNDMFMVNATWDSDGQFGAFENATIQLQGAWRETGYWYYQDRDFGPLTIDHVGSYGGNSSNMGVNRTTNELEFIFNGDISDRLHMTAGIYWLDDDAKTGDYGCLSTFRSIYDPATNTVDGEAICTPEGGTLMPRGVPIKPEVTNGGNGINNSYGRTTGESLAVYASFDYALTDRWTVAIGARAMQDDRTQENIELSTQECSANMDAEGSFCSPIILLNQSTMIDNGTYVNASGSDSAVTPSLSFTRSLDPSSWLDSGNIYFTLSEGYLTGAFNDEIPVNRIPEESKALAQSLISYDPEYVRNYEVGFKGSMNGGKVNLAAAVFYMDYTDKQEAISIDNTNGSLGPDDALEYTDNVGEVAVSGIEFELRTSPWDGGFVSVDAGYLNYDAKDFSYVDFNADPVATVVGVPPLSNRTPEWTITATVEHAFSLASGATLTPQLGVYMQAEYEWLSAFPSGGATVPEGYSSQLCHQDSYAKWRTRLTYEPAEANWQAAVWGANITDEEILLGCGANRSGTYRWYHQPPAQWGAEFTMRFGNRG